MDNASNEYFRNAVLTAPPEQLHLMLYDGAIRFTREGIDGINSQDWEKAFNGFSRSQKIVLEMLNSLNHEVDKPLCDRMASLYNFIYKKLVEACVERSVPVAEDALKLLEYQRETWVMLIEKLREEQAGQAAPSARMSEPPETPEESYGTLSVEG